MGKKKVYKFSYIIPALNEEKYIGKCIESINRQVLKPHEVIVVDNGSTDKTAAIARSLGARVIKESKKGIAHARNSGAKASSGNILCFIDADSEIYSGWAARSIFHFNRKSHAVVGLNIFTHSDLFKFLWYNTYTVIAHTYLAFNNFILGKLHLSAGNLAIKRETFLKTGGYEPYVGEDYWLSKKFWKLNLKGSFDPFMIVFSSSRGFDERGFLKTVRFWLKTTPKKADQANYSYRSDI